MKIELTAVFQQVAEGFIGFVEEVPGANTQGATLAVAGKTVLKEPLRISTA